MKRFLMTHKSQVLALAMIAALGLSAVALQSTAQEKAAEKKDTKADSKVDSQAAVAPKPSLAVTLTKATQQESAVTVNANGSIAAWQEVMVGSSSAGLRIDDVLVNVGDTVKRGQVLARFSQESIQADIASTKASIAEANAAIADALFNAERAKTLEASGAISAQQINQFNSNLAMARARLDAAKARLKSDEIRLKNTVLTSPDEGVVSMRQATIGMVPNPGQELFKIIRKNRLEWRAEVLSAELNRVAVGQNVNVSLPTGTNLVGKVRLISPTVDVQTRNALVYVDIPSGAAKPGMFARGSFDTGRSQALTLPQTAVLTRDGFTYAFVLNGNKVQQVKLSIGRRMGDRIEVLGGLAANASVVATGAGFLADGDVVRVVQ